MTRRIRDGGHATISQSERVQVSGRFKRFDPDGYAIVTIGDIEYRGTLIPTIVKPTPTLTRDSGRST